MQLIRIGQHDWTIIRTGKDAAEWNERNGRDSGPINATGQYPCLVRMVGRWGSTKAYPSWRILGRDQLESYLKMYVVSEED